jgi:hypothetical protein
MLDRSDVIVYVDPQLTRQSLGGYLAHNIVTGGAYRYLHVSVDVHGSLAVTFGCGGTSCTETQAAKDIEARVAGELAFAH